jgi:hypothetical protein
MRGRDAVIRETRNFEDDKPMLDVQREQVYVE